MFEYDARNRLTKRTDPLGKFELFEYDTNDNTTKYTDKKGRSSR
ncbi:MAG: RHS repeat protein [Pleurocapsa sp. SU_196_0]|nr:RHS repeat protein [Pleurocapsa sp. SU_196_0]